MDLYYKVYEESDRFHLDLLHRSRKMSQSDNLPEWGWIAFYRDAPIGAIFLRRIEGGFGMIDGLITYEKYPSIKRHEAIEELVRLLIEKAKELKLSGLMAFSRDISTLERARRIGFETQPDTFVILKL